MTLWKNAKRERKKERKKKNDKKQSSERKKNLRPNEASAFVEMIFTPPEPFSPDPREGAKNPLKRKSN